MSQRAVLSVFAVLALFALTVSVLAGGAAARALPGATSASGPVVVELFTSQGCSSCPPADRLLSKLSRDPRLAGRVIPLAFHVDYWDYIGWRDPFASPRWSQRQKDYARVFRSNRIYTPQLVVSGSTEGVGSQDVQRVPSQTSTHACASRWRMTKYPPSGLYSPP